ncbi:MAG: hypothetical protein QM630_03590 [Microbacterium sp.]
MEGRDCALHHDHTATARVEPIGGFHPLIGQRLAHPILAARVGQPDALHPGRSRGCGRIDQERTQSAQQHPRALSGSPYAVRNHIEGTHPKSFRHADQQRHDPGCINGNPDVAVDAELHGVAVTP